MIRFFFNLQLAGTVLRDEEGILLANDMAACREAGLIAADFVDRHSGEVCPGTRVDTPAATRQRQSPTAKPFSPTVG